jgi:hypothetical protein
MASAPGCCSASGDVLRSLLHLVSQPLTALHCALESSLEQDGKSQSDEIFVALEETDRVMEAMRLMREYLDADQHPSCAVNVSIDSTIKDVLEQLSEFADARGVKLFVFGSSGARILLRDVWLQRTLVYLVGALIETAPAGKAITILLEDCESHSIVCAYRLPVYAAEPGPSLPPDPNVLLQAKIAIAQRALESSGASVQLDWGDKAGFTIRIDRQTANQLSA